MDSARVWLKANWMKSRAKGWRGGKCYKRPASAKEYGLPLPMMM